MKEKMPGYMVVLLLVTLLGFRHPVSIELQGRVISDATGLPVTNAYLYTVEGEEETISAKNGKFRLISWRPLPLTLTVKHGDYLQQELRITIVPNNLEIKLKKKSN